MVRLVHGTWLVSVNDAWDFLQCPQSFMNRVDAASGIARLVPDPDQPLRRLMGEVLVEHRQRLANDLAHRTTALVTIPRPSRDGIGPDELLDSWQSSAEATTNALHTADAIIDPVFAERDHGVSGLPVMWTWSNDFIAHSPRFSPDIDQDGRGIEVWAAKLGSSQMGKTLFRLAATQEFAERHKIPTTNRVRIVFANGPDSLRGVHQSIDLWVDVRHTLPQAMSDHLASGTPLSWSSDQFAACGRKTCGWCSLALRHHDDLFLLPGISRDTRRHLRAAGFATVSGFATTSPREVQERVPAIDRGRLTRLHTQATLTALARGEEDGPPPFEVTNPGALTLLPPQTPEDLFIDFEADPTFRSWSETDRYFPTPPKDHPRWWLGMDYLLGVLSEGSGDAEGRFLGFWAESFEEEERNFLELLDLIDSKLEENPTMHVYHYAPYEKIALHRMARRYGHGRQRIARWERKGTLVDLYRIVTKAITAGLPNYSLKSVEKLFVRPGTRNSITGGAQSVESIWEYWHDLAAGNTVRAGQTRDRLVAYNTQDTVSTKLLATWLRTLSAD